MAYTEKILYNVELPQFLNKFKEACLSKLIPPIENAIQFLNTTDSPILTVLLIVLFVELVRLAILQVRNHKKTHGVAEQGDSRGAAREIKDLKRQLKGMQKTVEQLKQLGVGASSVSGRSSIISSSNTKSIINSCKDSWIKREEIALHIVQYQTLLMNEVRQLKRNGSRINSLSRISSSSPKQVLPNAKVSNTPNGMNSKAETKVPLILAKKVENPTNEQLPPAPRIPKAPIVKNNPQKLKQLVRIQLPRPIEAKVKQQPQPEAQVTQKVQQQTFQVQKPLPQTFTFQKITKTEEIHFQNAFIQKTQTQVIQQIKIEEKQTLIKQQVQLEQQITIEQSPKTIPPMPRPMPSVARRLPGPPVKGQKRAPPPPPTRKS